MYEAFFKLDRKPFQLSPDPGFFFGSAVHRRALAYLRYGVSQAEGFIAITGDVGTGKTTLVRMLFRELPAEEVIAAQIVTTQLEADDLLRMVAQAFGLVVNGASKSDLLMRIEAFLQARHREGKRALLVVDEAQNLPMKALEELRMLSNFQSGERPLLQSFLLGQNQFQQTLQHPDLEQLRQRFIAACHLTPLSASETRAYIESRLTTAGWHCDPSISEEAFAAIHLYSGGIPRRINTLADRLLLFAFLESRHDLDVAAVRTVGRELEGEIPPTRRRAAGAEGVQSPPDRYQEEYLELRVAALEERVAILSRYLRQRLAQGQRP